MNLSTQPLEDLKCAQSGWMSPVSSLISADFSDWDPLDHVTVKRIYKQLIDLSPLYYSLSGLGDFLQNISISFHSFQLAAAHSFIS